MNALLLFKVAQVAVFGVFFLYAMDIRPKPGMKPLISPALTAIMKAASFGVIGLYLYILATMDALVPLDAAGLALTALGTGLVFRAKRDLGLRHTWTGYCLKSTKVVQHGIYAHLRHPLYTGIYLFEIGAAATCLPRLLDMPWYALASCVAILTYVMVFNAVLAGKESDYLESLLGPEYGDYRRRVHAFLPFRRSA